jgi:hypothetical protein
MSKKTLTSVWVDNAALAELKRRKAVTGLTVSFQIGRFVLKELGMEVKA